MIISKKTRAASLKIARPVVAIFFLFFVLLAARPAAAVQLYFDNDSIQLPADQYFAVAAKVDPEKQCLNVVKTAISFPSDLVEVADIDYTDSIVGLWIANPLVLPDRVELTAGLPRGFCRDHFNPEQNILLKIIFHAKDKVGTGRIGYVEEKTNIFLNDGQGTPTTFALRQSNLQLYQPATGNLVSTSSAVIVDAARLPKMLDREAPQGLTIKKYQNDSRYYAAFYALDKQSGVDHYEISFADGPFVTADSPYEISGADLYNDFVVKAVDRAGNETAVAATAMLTKIGGTIRLSIIALLVLAALWGAWLMRKGFRHLLTKHNHKNEQPR